MKKLAVAILLAMGVSTAAIAQQQPGQSPGSSSSQRDQSSSRSEPRGGDRTEQASFDTTDRNGDGRISREEGNVIDGFDFSRADTNNDASLSRQEFQAAMATATPRRDGPDANDGRGAAAGQRGDGAGSARSGAAGGADADSRGRSGAATAQASFDTVDKNKDGKLSRDEANDVRGLNFSSADVNDDASLSRQEFQTAMAGAQPRG
jgi:Ca2+-binding EF-hand superfamily protein